LYKFCIKWRLTFILNLYVGHAADCRTLWKTLKPSAENYLLLWKIVSLTDPPPKAANEFKVVKKA